VKGDALGPPPAAPAPRVPSDRLGLRGEAMRKLIHVGTMVVPFLVWFLPYPAALSLLIAGAAAAAAIEWARSGVRWARYAFLRRTRRLLRAHERRGIAGATYMAFGYLVAFLFFPKPVAVAGMLYNAFGDTAAALVGKRWGRHRTAWGKSAEGALAGFVVNLAVGLAVPGIGSSAALAGAAAASSLEFLPLPLDDNLRITVGGALALWLATLAAASA
jgi:dolichol kinase